MKELYVEGPANHDGPEPCVDVPRGRGEALDRGMRRPGIEPRNQSTRGADAVVVAEGNTGGSATRELPSGPARSETLCMRRISVRENREASRSPDRPITGRAAQGRPRPQA
jgi:RNA-directed DNA polymerase